MCSSDLGFCLQSSHLLHRKLPKPSSVYYGNNHCTEVLVNKTVPWLRSPYSTVQGPPVLEISRPTRPSHPCGTAVLRAPTFSTRRLRVVCLAAQCCTMYSVNSTAAGEYRTAPHRNRTAQRPASHSQGSALHYEQQVST